MLFFVMTKHRIFNCFIFPSAKWMVKLFSFPEIFFKSIHSTPSDHLYRVVSADSRGRGGRGGRVLAFGQLFYALSRAN